jgi:hypothetical protein
VTIERKHFEDIAQEFYIGAYMQVRTAYRIRWKIIYGPFETDKLADASPVTSGTPYYEVMDEEWDEKFYSFQPWWSGAEKHEVVLTTETIYGSVFFYTGIDMYPRHWIDSYQDWNDAIKFTPDEITFNRENTFYTRVRPDFHLYDLIASKETIYNFYAIAQRVDIDFIPLQLNTPIIGFANTTDNTNYRHFIIDPLKAYTTTLKPIEGASSLLIKIASEVSFMPTLSDFTSYDFKDDSTSKTETKSITITQDQREDYEFECKNDYMGYYRNGGAIKCVYYVAVECVERCIYELEITMQDQPTDELPAYLLDREYETGTVGFGEVNYYYFPLAVADTQEIAMVLNKTAQDSYMVMNVQGNSTLGYKDWTYPTKSKYDAISKEGNKDISELIVTCDAAITKSCDDTSSCILIIGIYGNSDPKDNEVSDSSYRLIVHGNNQKLVSEEPRNATLTNIGDIDYYWFVNAPGSKFDPDSDEWAHFFGVNVGEVD